MPTITRLLTVMILLAVTALAAVKAAERPPASYTPDVTYTLKTAIAEGKLVYIGVGGTIAGAVNPTLRTPLNAVVQIVLVNGDGAEHDIAFPDFKAHSDHLNKKDSSTALVFRADKPGTSAYFCTLPGHRQAGMEGAIVVGQEPPKKEALLLSVSADPLAIPPPLPKRGPATVRVDLEAVEMEARLADGVSYRYWTFNRKVPGPFIRVRQGDTVEVHMKNARDSKMIHSVDFHAATGPGGGAAVTQTSPGGETRVTFKALNPGLYVYHCATPMVAHHITNGMYGLILVEPENGLAKVDREFYVMQGELYTRERVGQLGPQEFSVEKLLDERPEYFVFNGAVGSLTKEHSMKAKVGETVRIFFGVGGPNFVSSFHVIGEIFDRVYDQASLTSPPLADVQTTLVPAGGATVVEFKLDVPGRYILVDHSLSRLERGLVGFLLVEGKENPSIFKGRHSEGGGH